MLLMLMLRGMAIQPQQPIFHITSRNLSSYRSGIKC